MMSDHLCSMNETLSKQREEIDTLKMSSKVGKGKEEVSHIQYFICNMKYFIAMHFRSKG